MEWSVQRETRNKESLRHHQVMIARSLADVTCRKTVGHLPPEDVAQLITDLEKRLAVVTERLASSPFRDN